MSIPHDPDCLFCKIVAGDVPAARVYEDEHVIAFLDINPTRPGHTLVIPRGHWPTIFDLPEELNSPILQAVKKVGTGVLHGTGATGLNLGQNNHADAGQVIFHLHFHLIPRIADDGLKFWNHSSYPSDDAMQQTAHAIHSAIQQGR